MNISVIIPALNEEEVIEKTIRAVYGRAEESALIKEVIVVDGGSTDGTASLAGSTGATVVQSAKGRAVQMNRGAEKASGEILYFLHADTIPPNGYDRRILKALTKRYSAGCFRLSFDHKHVLLKCYAWFTRFDVNAFRFGDQSLFMTADLFRRIGGFREDLVVMEDNEIVTRIKKHYAFVILPEKVSTSARKYIDVGVVKLQAIFCLIFLGYHLGISQATLVSWYKKLLRR